jgi:hypothetical protein
VTAPRKIIDHVLYNQPKINHLAKKYYTDFNNQTKPNQYNPTNQPRQPKKIQPFL